MKNKWILFVASRYIFKGRGNSPVLALLGIAFGVLALIVIISVMNGFQLGFIESILEVSSYHLRLNEVPEENIELARELILYVPGVRAAVPFREFQALLRGRRAGQQVALIRGLPCDAIEHDRMMAGHLNFEAGNFDITENNFILLGAELARRLGLTVGDSVTVFSLTGIMAAEDDEGTAESFIVRGIFRTGYFEFDAGWAFVNIENRAFLLDESELTIGIKITNRFHDRHILHLVNRRLQYAEGFENIVLSSWRDYNRAFFGALRTEKLFMFILVGLIFLVVGLNIFQSQRRAVLQRREEVGLLRAVGGAPISVRFVFILDGAIIGFAGASLGMIFGILTASNVPQFFSALEIIVNTFIGFLNLIAGFFGAGQAGDFAVFSPAVFYIKEIPSRIIPQEVALIFLFGFFSALFAAWFASAKVSKIQPAEVLRYE